MKTPFVVSEAPDGALRMEKVRELPGRAVAVSVNVRVVPVLVSLFPGTSQASGGMCQRRRAIFVPIGLRMGGVPVVEIAACRSTPTWRRSEAKTMLASHWKFGREYRLTGAVTQTTPCE